MTGVPNPRLVLAVLVSTVVLTGCADDAPSGPDASDCGEIAQLARYSALRQLVAGQRLADPAAAFETAGAGLSGSPEGPYALVARETFEDLDDATQQQVLSTIESESVGVGTEFSSETLWRDLDATGPCHDLMD